MKFTKINKLLSFSLTILLALTFFCFPKLSSGSQDYPCLDRITWEDAILVADTNGRILIQENASRKCVPASTLKLLTALAALHYLGESHRFQTEFYMDSDNHLKIKGYGDPLLISEVWQEIAYALRQRLKKFNDLILDDTYFSPQIEIPGRNRSTNPYDAPTGALCANFNTIFFDSDQKGNIVSAEPQTPLIPFSLERIKSLGLKKGRYTFSHKPEDAARYAGELLIYFLKKQGVKHRGGTRRGVIGIDDKRIYTYQSRFSLEEAIGKMMEFSNNFMANQIFLAVGAHVHGPPATLAKGVQAVSDFSENEFHLAHFDIVEGSGISRENRLSALHMLTLLNYFRPYRHLLERKDGVLFKTGSLRGISTRAGYIEVSPNEMYPFVVFLNRSGPDMENIMACLKNYIKERSKNSNKAY